MRTRIVAALLATALVISGCMIAGPQFGANPYPPPPPVPAEAVPRPPVSEVSLIWQPGHWDWTGASYAWTAGIWISRAGHGTAWQDGYWTPGQDGQWVWFAGHWI